MLLKFRNNKKKNQFIFYYFLYFLFILFKYNKNKFLFI